MYRQTGHNARARRSGTAVVRLSWAFAFAAFIAADSLAGSKTSADFLKIPIGAHGAGLGQAYMASTEGVDAINWNPAGLAATPAYTYSPTLGLTLTHQQHLVDTSLDHLGLVLPSRSDRLTALGFNVIRLSYGSQDKRAHDRTKIGTFQSADLMLGLAAARRVGDARLGGQVKLIRQDLAGLTASGFALDFGLQGPGPIDRMSYGVSVRNLGPRMKFVGESFRLPLTLSVGTAYRASGPLTFLVDLHARPYQDQVSLAAGAQFAAAPSVTLRAGYLARVAETVRNSQQTETERGSFGMYGLAAGLGLRFDQFAMDYAITPFGELGNAQTLTLASWFGGVQPVPPLRDLEAVPVGAPLSGDDRSILILPLDHERWWNDLR